jgi:hypothetical protein
LIVAHHGQIAAGSVDINGQVPALCLQKRKRMDAVGAPKCGALFIASYMPAISSWVKRRTPLSFSTSMPERISSIFRIT